MAVSTIAAQNEEPDDAHTALLLALFLRYVREGTERREAALRREFQARGTTAEDIGAALAEDRARDAEFTRFAVERLRRDLPVAVKADRAANVGPSSEGSRTARILARERRYSKQRTIASVARIGAAVERAELRRTSPTGAFWLLDPLVKEHTEGCLYLGMKFWPWVVLDRVHPPRHPGCPCKLRSYGWAVQAGVLRRGSIMDVADAIRSAAHVVMEAEEAERLARSIEGPALFDALLSYGEVKESDRETFLKEYAG